MTNEIARALMMGVTKADALLRIRRIERIARMKNAYDAIRVGALGLFRTGKGKHARTVRARAPKHHPHGDRRRLLALPARRRRKVLRAIAMQATAPSRSMTHLWPPQTGKRRREFSSVLKGQWSQTASAP